MKEKQVKKMILLIKKVQWNLWRLILLMKMKMMKKFQK